MVTTLYKHRIYCLYGNVGQITSDVNTTDTTISVQQAVIDDVTIAVGSTIYLDNGTTKSAILKITSISGTTMTVDKNIGVAFLSSTPTSVIREEHWVYKWTESADALVTCPEDPSHPVRSGSESIIEEHSDDLHAIKEETVPTGGFFQASTINVVGTRNQVTSTSLDWPHPISILATNFTTEATHIGDIVNVYIGAKNTTIGIITANKSPATAWTSQNYVVGDCVTYNGKTYTCVVNTVSNEPPTIYAFWKRGVEVSVSQTVIDNTTIGRYVTLFDGTNTDDLGRVISIGSGLKIYVEKNMSNSFLAGTPTYVRQTIYMVKNLIIGPAWHYVVGESKIGGSSIPADTAITVEYDNKSTDTDKTIIGLLEYLY